MLFLLGLSHNPPALPQAKAQVMILGMYHMANPGLDLVKVKIRDTMSPERQKEIQELVVVLAKFKPTKIAVEAAPESPSVTTAYPAHLRGEHELTANETQQVGFRLGKQFQHSKIYGVDYQLGMDFDKLVTFANENKQKWFLDLMQKAMTSLGPKFEEIDRRFTVSQILAIHNSPDAIRFSHSMYLEMMKLNTGSSYPGVEVVADWYKRNMVIFSNIRRVIDSPSERVLVLYGAGHTKLLRDFVSDSADLELIEPSKYLPKPPPFDLRF